MAVVYRQPVLKSLEVVAKLALAVVLALLLWRPRRQKRLARLASARNILVVRIDRRVGEVLLTTPLLRHLEGLHVDFLVHPDMVRVAKGLPGVAEVLPFVRTLRTVKQLRTRRYDVVINAANWTAPSVTSAIVSRLAAPHGVVLGPATPPASWLMDVAVPPAPQTLSEAAQRQHLASPLQRPASTHALRFRVPQPSDAIRTFRATLGARFVVINPGGRLGARRIAPSVFAAAATRCLAAGVTSVVTWGPGEQPLVDDVIHACPRVTVAPPTNMDDVAYLMAEAALTVCNNTGPMHLAVAVGSPTLALFTGFEVARWGHAYPPHQMLNLTDVAPEDAAARVSAAVDMQLASR